MENFNLKQRIKEGVSKSHSKLDECGQDGNNILWKFGEENL